MAGLNESTRPVGWDHDRNIDASPDLSDKSEHDPKLKDFDVEGQGRNGSRNDITAIDGSSTTESVGRQIDMESENTIKYRTCSWQKVRVGWIHDKICINVLTVSLDCRIAFLRVHLLGHYVLPLVVLNSRPCSWFDTDRGDRRYRAVHFADHLVRMQSVLAHKYVT
jgi:hypothetical protein